MPGMTMLSEVMEALEGHQRGVASDASFVYHSYHSQGRVSSRHPEAWQNLAAPVALGMAVPDEAAGEAWRLDITYEPLAVGGGYSATSTSVVAGCDAFRGRIRRDGLGPSVVARICPEQPTIDARPTAESVVFELSLVVERRLSSQAIAPRSD